MKTHPVQRTMTKRFLTAALAVAAIGGLVFGVSDVSAANHRERAGKKIACVQLRAGANNLESSLDQLVQDGTISAEQQAAIVDKLSKSMGVGARICTGMEFVRDRAVGSAITELLGMDRAEIRIEWLDGKSLAEIAEAQGVDRQTLVETITTAIDTRLNEAVENGRITAERKAEIEADLPATVEKAVDTHLSDVVDQLRDAHDKGSDAPATPVSTTGFSSIA